MNRRCPSNMCLDESYFDEIAQKHRGVKYTGLTLSESPSVTNTHASTTANEESSRDGDRWQECIASNESQEAL